jgi:hypothetical protein
MYLQLAHTIGPEKHGVLTRAFELPRVRKLQAPEACLIGLWHGVSAAG